MDKRRVKTVISSAVTAAVALPCLALSPAVNSSADNGTVTGPVSNNNYAVYSQNFDTALSSGSDWMLPFGQIDPSKKALVEDFRGLMDITLQDSVNATVNHTVASYTFDLGGSATDRHPFYFGVRLCSNKSTPSSDDGLWISLSNGKVGLKINSYEATQYVATDIDMSSASSLNTIQICDDMENNKITVYKTVNGNNEDLGDITIGADKTVLTHGDNSVNSVPGHGIKSFGYFAAYANGMGNGSLDNLSASLPEGSFLPAKSSSVYDGYTMDTYSSFDGYNSIVSRPMTDGQPAYNYSVNMVKVSKDNSYRAYFGARWKSDKGDGDHVLLYSSPTGDGGSYAPLGPEPLFWQGQEEGIKDTWYCNNVLEPEPMLAADGKWIMYTQVEVDKGQVEDTGEKNESSADRIMLLTSPDGINNWTRKTDRGVVTNITDPANTMVHHEEAIYVPWDKDGECYWLYFGLNVDGNYTGIYRIRSSDYTTFDFSKKENVSGFAQIGNQIGYLKEAPGGPIFVRITFEGSPTVPALQFSRDGLNWSSPSNDLEGPSPNKNNNNCYFLGISTIDGQGAIEYQGNNTWTAKYAATTCNTPVNPEIFNAAIGGGTVKFQLTPNGGVTASTTK